MKRSGINALGIVFGILSIIIVLAVSLALIKGQSGRSPFVFNFDFDMKEFEDIFKGNELEESGEEIFSGSYRELSIETISGDISITGWQEDYIQLKYTKSAPTQEHLDSLEVEIDDNGDSIDIERDFTGSGISPRGEIDFSLYIPADMIGELTVKTISGKIVSTNGSKATDMKLQTTSGRINIDAAQDIEAKTISGEIQFISFGNELDVRTTSGRINGEYRSTENRGNIDIHSVSGAVRLTVPDSFGADVDIRSVSGSVDTDFPIKVTSSKRNSLEGMIGDGGVSVNINTTTGSINIRKASGDE